MHVHVQYVRYSYSQPLECHAANGRPLARRLFVQPAGYLFKLVSPMCVSAYTVFLLHFSDFFEAKQLLHSPAVFGCQSRR